MNDGAGRFTESEPVEGPGGESLVAADFDGDGALDLASRGSVFWNEGGFRLTEQEVAPPSFDWRPAQRWEAVTADWDSDGLPDLAFVGFLPAPPAAGTRELRVYRSLGDRRFELAGEWSWEQTGRALIAGDFDGDGDPDLAVGLPGVGGRTPSGLHSWARERGAVEILRGDGAGGFELAAHIPFNYRPGGLFARDLDQDGDDDLVVSGGLWPFRDEIQLFLSGGAGLFEEVRTYAVDGGAGFVVADDLDRDGRLDLAVSTRLQVSVLLNEAPRQAPDSGRRSCGGGRVFRRGDADGNGQQNVHDAIVVLHLLFGGLESQPHCLKAADADDDGRLTVRDAVLLVRYTIFLVPELRGLPAPFPGCGLDPTEDALSCEEPVSCR